MAENVGNAIDVGGRKFVEFFRRYFPEGHGVVDDGGIVDEEVGSAGSFKGGIAEALATFIAGDISRKEMTVGIFFPEMLEGDFVSSASDDGMVC